MSEAPSDEKKPGLLDRRDILKIAGVTTIAAIFSEMVITGPFSTEAVSGIGRDDKDSSDSDQNEWHMVIDLEKCIGCQYCIRACQATNDIPEDDMRWNVGFPDTTETGAQFYMTRPCLHCNEAPCVKVCPVGATYKRKDGLIVMDYGRCIGCRYCQVACPYDARNFNWKESSLPNPYVPDWGTPEIARRSRGVVEKCTFCIQRIDRGLAQGLTPGVDPQATPACVNICPVNARVFGNINDPESPVSKYIQSHDTFRLREDFGTEPKVHYVRPVKEA
jgi:Fe-S-cluster-containing dehydrogenase component